MFIGVNGIGELLVHPDKGVAFQGRPGISD